MSISWAMRRFKQMRRPSGHKSKLTAHLRLEVLEDRTVLSPALLKDLTTFARVWDRNIKAQGFVEAAERQAAEGKKVA